jgi:hypothetical protein
METPGSQEARASSSSLLKATVTLLVFSGLLSVGAVLFAVFFPEQAAGALAWVLQKLCDLLLGRRC